MSRRRSAKERERERENEDVFFNMRDIVHLVGKKRKAFSKYIYIYLSIHPSIGCKHTQKGRRQSLRVSQTGVNRLRPSRRMKKRRASFPIGRRGEKRRRSHFHIQRGISQRNCMWVPVEPVSQLSLPNFFLCASHADLSPGPVVETYSAQMTFTLSPKRHLPKEREIGEKKEKKKRQSVPLL